MAAVEIGMRTAAATTMRASQRSRNHRLKKHPATPTTPMDRSLSRRHVMTLEPRTRVRSSLPVCALHRSEDCAAVPAGDIGTATDHCREPADAPERHGAGRGDRRRQSGSQDAGQTVAAVETGSRYAQRVCVSAASKALSGASRNHCGRVSWKRRLDGEVLPCEGPGMRASSRATIRPCSQQRALRPPPAPTHLRGPGAREGRCRAIVRPPEHR